MSATSMRRTDRTRESEALSASVLLASRGSSSSHSAYFERDRKVIRRAASWRTALPARGGSGLTMEMAR
ncbi:uncharacterized protein SOCEGT47_032880 [Sorangium cellulosum]|uniref:Uncharacterized protein n=1 Tax=Sorangium cellulosum TaxID=56 RepID=A0A4P2Q1G0_SORCE|nr:uncharacterized protein SOCEGT47_032880 [Sorangium cellulosum]